MMIYISFSPVNLNLFQESTYPFFRKKKVFWKEYTLNELIYHTFPVNNNETLAFILACIYKAITLDNGKKHNRISTYMREKTPKSVQIKPNLF